jgi:hypothetical protein
MGSSLGIFTNEHDSLKVKERTLKKTKAKPLKVTASLPFTIQPLRLVPYGVSAMRVPALILASIGLVSCSLAAADDATDPKAIIEEALKAKGQKIDDKSVPETWKGKGTFNGGGFKIAFTSDWAFQGPDKYRFNMKADFMEFEIVVIVNGDKAWESGFGQSREITEEKLDYIVMQVYQLRVNSLVTPLQDKEFKLSYEGEKAVGCKSARVIKVTHEKRPAVPLFSTRNPVSW